MRKTSDLRSNSLCSFTIYWNVRCFIVQFLSLTISIDTSHLNVCFKYKKSHKSKYIKEDKAEGLPGKRKALRFLLFSSSTCVTFLLLVLWFKKIWFCPRCSWSTRDRMSSVALKIGVQTVYLYLHLQ